MLTKPCFPVPARRLGVLTLPDSCRSKGEALKPKAAAMSKIGSDRFCIRGLHAKHGVHSDHTR